MIALGLIFLEKTVSEAEGTSCVIDPIWLFSLRGNSILSFSNALLAPYLSSLLIINCHPKIKEGN